MIVKQSIPGSLAETNGKTVLRMDESKTEEPVYLAYALVTQGHEHPILPSVLLDDWGNQIGQLELYQWIRDNGLQFPRAEVFGISPSGAQVQYFLRDLELFAKYPVYAFASKDAPDSSGILLQAVLISDEKVEAAQPTAPPDEVSPPLREAQLSWWRINPRQVDLGFIE